jgi:hypothetical protein
MMDGAPGWREVDDLEKEKGRRVVEDDGAMGLPAVERLGNGGA